MANETRYAVPLAAYPNLEVLNQSTPHVAMIPGEAEFREVRRQMYNGTRVLAYFLRVDQLNGFWGQLSPFPTAFLCMTL